MFFLFCGRYIENFLFGVRGAEDSVKTFFLGIADPYAKDPLPSSV